MLTARFNQQEADALRQMAEAAGLPVSTLIRECALGAPAPRAARRPTVNHQAVARLLVELGRIAQALRDTVESGNVTPSNPHVVAALRDLAEMRCVCMEALGREP